MKNWSEAEKMKFILALVALVGLCEARPSKMIDQGMPTTFSDVDSFIIGGSNVNPAGSYPHQLSQQRLGTTWSHSCGASLLKARYGLSAAHCVDGATVSSVRVIAGLHDRTNMAGTVTANLASYKMHEQYNTGGGGSYPNDIAILTFSTNINPGTGIAYATIPANNNNLFAGSTCIITGWGRTSSSNTLPNILQQASVGILSTAQCQAANMAGNSVSANHICCYDSANTRGACNGDSGGPVNCNGIVAGIASFVFQSGGNCLPSRPSVYTRVGSYVAWINTNTP